MSGLAAGHPRRADRPILYARQDSAIFLAAVREQVFGFLGDDAQSALSSFLLRVTACYSNGFLSTNAYRYNLHIYDWS